VDIKTDHHALVEYDPAINSYVLFTPPVGTSDKLLPRHTSTHIHNLRPFNYDRARTSPLAIAQQDEQEFVVKSINGDRGNRQRHSTIELKVRWAR
jgi:hypothetical protein